MFRRLSALLSGLLVCAAVGLVTAPPAAAGASCGQVWGSQAKGGGSANDMTLVAIRTGRHACYERLVLQFDEPLLGWSANYTNAPLLTRERGGASLNVNAFTKTPPLTLALTDRRVANVGGYRTFRDVRSTSAVTTAIQLDVRSRLPFRAFVLPGPDGGSRLVIDVGHRWCSAGQSRC